MPKINITLKGLKRKPQEEEEPRRHVVWPTMIPDDDYQHGNVEVFLYRGDTRRTGGDSGPWELISDWEGALSEKSSYTLDLDDEMFAKYNEKHIFHYIGNDYKVAESVIATEYGSDNEHRWIRHPIFLVTDRDGETYTQWNMANGLTDRPLTNVRCRLRKAADTTKYETSPDLNSSGDQKGTWRYDPGYEGNGPDDEPADLKLIGPALARYGLSLEEVGTKAVAHYIGNDDPFAQTVGYTMEWIEPEGIMFQPFNTADSDNFKVTREPSYSADAVNGKFIRPDRNRTVEVYWMPRRWAYYCRTFETEHYTSGEGTYTFTRNILCEQPPGSDSTQRCDFNIYYPESVQPWYQATGNPTCSQFTYSPFDCAEYILEPSASFQTIEWEVVNFSGSFEGEWYTIHYQCTAGDCIGIPTTDEVDIQDEVEDSWWEKSYTVTYGGDIMVHEVNHNVCLWWGSPPLTQTPLYKPGQQETMTVLTFHADDDPPTFEYPSGINYPGSGWGGDEDHREEVTLFLGETLTEAKTHALAAGIDSDVVDAIITGYSSTGILKTTRWFRVAPEDLDGRIPTVGEVDFTTVTAWPASPWTSTFNLTPFDGYMTGSDEDYGRLQIGFPQSFWDAYYAGYSGNIYDKYVSPLVDSRLSYDDIPWGVGLSPAIEGTLCAVIKYDNSVLFVWRKTAETFTLRQAHISGPSFTLPLLSFEDAVPDLMYELEICFSGTGRKLDAILPPKQLICAGYDELDITDIPPTDHVGCDYRVHNFVEVSGAGTYQLESPVYPIFSREYSGMEPSGTSTHLRYRMLRGATLVNPVYPFTDDDFRNSF